MPRFSDLIKPMVLTKGKHTLEDFKIVGKNQRAAEEAFPTLVQESNLNLWKPGDLIPQIGDRYLIGTACWNGYDMRLLDLLDDWELSDNMDTRIDVFDFGAISGEPEFHLEDYIPGLNIKTIQNPPVVGYWQNGVLQASSSGPNGCQLIADRLGIPDLWKYVSKRGRQ